MNYTVIGQKQFLFWPIECVFIVVLTSALDTKLIISFPHFI